ncbi:hypothetical protein Cni_G07104 [Canna indica]|uniref:RNase H type-1 domain-containing protein n=1 Tax=Canna indica TaxID=4628 RepID=A0AAQ3Q5E5_9LILI|nr:hypothetical protein Cni_G07104 [Canna indica]
MEINRCYVCNHEEDDSNHFLLECSFAKSYWELTQKRLEIVFSRYREWKEGLWMYEDAGYNADSGSKLIALIIVSLWLLWKNRNNCKFSDKKKSLNFIFVNAFNLAMEYCEMQIGVKKRLAKHRNIAVDESNAEMAQFQLWENIFLCCDAAWTENKEAGVGYAVFEQGRRILMGDARKHIGEVLDAELYAIWYGLDNVRKKGLCNVVVFSDCANAIKILKGVYEVPWQIRSLVNKIWSLERDVKVIDWFHIKRSVNCVAHYLAKVAYEDSFVGNRSCIN